MLRATEQLLRVGSPHEVTVEAITARAKLSRTAFYFYFASKEEAIARLAQAYLGEIFDAAQPVFDAGRPLPHAVRGALENQVEVWGRHGRALAAVADAAGADPVMRRLWVGEIERFVEPVSERMAAWQQERGLPTAPNNELRARALVWMLERYYYMWASGHYEHTPESLVEGLYDVVMLLFGER